MRNRSFLALCVLILVNQLGFGLIVPVLPSYAKHLGLSAGAVGLVIGVYGFARFLANVPAGQIAERRGRRTVLVLGTVITTAAAALMATAANLPQLLAYRLLAGIGAATVLTGGQIMVGDIATPANRGRLMSTYQGFFLIGVGLGPTPGGILADQFGLRATFVAYAAASAAACVLAMVLIRETRPATLRPAASARQVRERTDATAGETLRSVALSAPFVLIGTLSFVAFFARTGAMFTVVPLLGKERIGLSSSQIGFGQTAVNLLNLMTLYHAGLFADRYGRKAVIVPATIVSGLSVALFALVPNYLVYMLASCVWGIGSGISGPAPAAYVADLSPPALRGQLFGLYRSVADSGYIVGPLLLGWLTDAAGHAIPLWLTCALFLISGALFGRFAPELYRRPLAPPREAVVETTAT